MAKRKRVKGAIRKQLGSTSPGDVIVDRDGKRWSVITDCSIQVVATDDTGRERWFMKKDIKLSA